MKSKDITKDKAFRYMLTTTNVCGFIFILVACWILYIGTFKPAFTLYEISRSVPVDAVAVNVEQIQKKVWRSKGGRHSNKQRKLVPYERTTFEYTVDGRVYAYIRDISLEKNTISANPRVPKGEKIKLYVNPNDPEKVLESFSPLWLISGVLGFLVFLCVAMFFFRFKRKLIKMASDPALQKQINESNHNRGP